MGQAAEMSFLCRVAGLSRGDSARGSEIRVEPLLEAVRAPFFGGIEDIVVDSKNTGEIMNLMWPGSTSGYHRRSWKSFLGGGTC